ncbi:MAG: MFS transporter, partial [Sediminibacterium sp.]|nr:MFS transporter [Sediminibacterium sp.]
MFLASIGGIMEYYDFAVYGTFAIYFGNQFFPAANKLTNILEVFLVWFLGFALRPVGGILFSHIGDEYGRKMVLTITVLMMGLSSLGVALLPNFATIGYYAPILLLILRLMQGLAMGGEIPTTCVYLRESFQKKLVLVFSIFVASLFIGYLLSSITNFILVQILTYEQLVKFGWRIPFFLGSVICIIAYYIRKTLHETNDFKNILNRAKIPLLLLFRNYKKTLLVALFVAASQQVFSVVIVAFLQTLLKLFTNLSNHQISNIYLIAILCTALFMLIMGYILKSNKNYMRLYQNCLLFN